MAASTSKPKRKDGPSGEIVLAHKAIFARHSSLMRDIFDVAEKKQVCIIIVIVRDAIEIELHVETAHPNQFFF